MIKNRFLNEKGNPPKGFFGHGFDIVLYKYSINKKMTLLEHVQPKPSISDSFCKNKSFFILKTQHICFSV